MVLAKAQRKHGGRGRTVAWPLLGWWWWSSWWRSWTDVRICSDGACNGYGGALLWDSLVQHR